MGVGGEETAQQGRVGCRRLVVKTSVPRQTCRDHRSTAVVNGATRKTRATERKKNGKRTEKELKKDGKRTKKSAIKINENRETAAAEKENERVRFVTLISAFQGSASGCTQGYKVHQS